MKWKSLVLLRFPVETSMTSATTCEWTWLVAVEVWVTVVVRRRIEPIGTGSLGSRFEDERVSQGGWREVD